jgi:hypothetical protein
MKKLIFGAIALAIAVPAAAQTAPAEHKMDCCEKMKSEHKECCCKDMDHKDHAKGDAKHGDKHDAKPDEHKNHQH